MKIVATTINEKTFSQFRFHRHIPKGTWTVTAHEALSQWSEYQKTILLGICEVLSGAVQYGDDKGMQLVEVQYPPDFGQHGFSVVDIDYGAKTVFVRNMITTQTPVQYFTFAD